MPTNNTASKQIKEGVIVEFNDDAGFAYVLDEKLNRQFIFGYDKIDGYAGQAGKEMHLDTRKEVHFTLENDIVQSVDLS